MKERTAIGCALALALAGCAGDGVGIARLALEGAPEGVDDLTLTLAAPDLPPRSVAVELGALTFDVAVAPGAARTLALLATHDEAGAALPWYWGITEFDVAADEVVDVVVPAVSAGRLVATPILAGSPVESAIVTALLDAPLPDLPDRFGGDAGAFDTVVPGGTYCLSAVLEADGVRYATVEAAHRVLVQRGQTVQVPLELVGLDVVPLVDHLDIEVASVRVGEATDIVVRALDALGAVVADFDGTVALSASVETAVALPAPYRFDPTTDGGEHRFPAGLQGLSAALGVTIEVHLQDEPAVAARRAIDVLSIDEVVGDAVRLTLEVLGEVTGGLLAHPVDLRVTALDAAGRLASGYRGTVTFADSDLALLALPADTAFSADDQGSHLFEGGVLALLPIGTAVVRVRDTDDESISGTLSIDVQ